MSKISKPKSPKGAPPTPSTPSRANLSQPDPNALANMNFKVSPDFHQEFKSYAINHGLSMLEVLEEGFELVKKQRGS